MPEDRDLTLADLFEQYALEYLTDKAQSTQYSYHCFFARTLRELGPQPLTALTPEVLRAWKLQLLRRVRPATVRIYMKILSAVLRVAVEEYGYLVVHPLKRVRTPAAAPERVRFLTREEWARLSKACQASTNTDLADIVLTALWTGGRKNEVRRLTWTAVDLTAGVVRFLRTKTSKDRTVPLLGEARSMLAARAALRAPSVPWVFPRADGRKPRWIEHHWRLARAEAGLADLHFHDLRHTYASYLAMSGASLKDIAELLGHTALQQTAKYTHLLQSHTQGVVERMIGKFLHEGRDTEPPL